jgi:hypothetical protein
MSSADKWMELEDIMLSEISQVQKAKSHISSYMWKIDLKDKRIHKTKHDHVHIYIENTSVIVKLLYGI